MKAQQNPQPQPKKQAPQPQQQPQRSPQTPQDKTVIELCRIYNQVAEMREEMQDLKSKLKKWRLVDAVAWGVFIGMVTSGTLFFVLTLLGIKFMQIEAAKAEARAEQQRLEEIHETQSQMESQLQEYYRQLCETGNQYGCQKLNNP